MAARPDTAPAVHVAGALAVVPRPAERRLRSALPGRGWERPPISASLDWRRGGWSRTAPSPCRCGVAPSQQSLREGCRAPLPGAWRSYRIGRADRWRACRCARASGALMLDPDSLTRRAIKTRRPPQVVDRSRSAEFDSLPAGIIGGERPPRGRGRACENGHSPAPVPGPRTGGVATLRGPSGYCATAACAAKPQDVAAPADKLASRCASPERQNVHRPPLSLAHLQYGTGHQASHQNRASASRIVRHVATRSVSPRPARLLARLSRATARFNAACNPPY